MILTLLACTQLTPYRQATFTPPSSPPVNVGAPVDAGVLVLGGGLEGRETGLGSFVGVAGDPAVYAPIVSAEGHATIGLARWLDLGLDGQYARMDWAERSGVGVMAIPGDPSLWGVGGHLTGGWRDEHWGVGATVTAQYWSLPFARYAYVGPAQVEDFYTNGNAAGAYALEETGRDPGLRIGFATGASLRFGVFDSAFGVALVPDFSNVGFSEEPHPPWEMSGVSVVPTLDLGFLIGPTRVAAQGWWASGTSHATNTLQTGLGGRLVFEVRPRLWGGAPATPPEEIHHPAPD